ncbi:MAG: DUF3854 domain-containing protein, partial [Bacteroidetes bacterium]|nr:DUF3854 domain-containing protein [Bacteroidota bacterium]
SLDDRHRDELLASGLTDDTIRDAGLYSADSGSVASILGWKPNHTNWGRALVFPFPNLDSSPIFYSRIKPDFPRTSRVGKRVKYESPRNHENRAYFPPRFIESFAAQGIVIVTEGEKKALAAFQAGFCCVGLVGVWGFQRRRHRDDRGKVFGPRQLIPDLQGLDWADKRVCIVFDSDVESRMDLQVAEFRLAELLTGRGATVRVARLPSAGDAKVGLDDFLVQRGDAGPAQLQKLIDIAKEPELPNLKGPMDLAKIMVDEVFTCDTGVRLRWWRDEFYSFNRRCYESVPESELIANVLKWLDFRGLPATPRGASDIVKCLGALCQVKSARNAPCWLDNEKMGDGWVSFKNGLFRITGESAIRGSPHTARYFTPWAMDYPFDSNAGCEEWLTFLDDVFDADTERIDLLQRWFGLLLTSDTSFQKLLLMIGPPRAGKGTIVRVIRSLVGPANCAAPTLSSLANRFCLASLMTKTVAIMPDAHIGRHADGIRVAEVLKSVVGEDPQDIDRKYKPPLSAVRLPTRFVVSCNELNHFTDASGALAARLSIIPFEKSYLGREDRTLEARLGAELSGIVNWSIVGLARLGREGRLIVPSKSQPIHDNFKRISSPTAAFADDCLEVHPTFSEETNDLYDAWVGWCRINGHEAGSNARLGERLRAVNPSIERARHRVDGVRSYLYSGVRLTPVGHEMKQNARSIDTTRGRNGGLQ